MNTDGPESALAVVQCCPPTVFMGSGFRLRRPRNDANAGYAAGGESVTAVS
jgi:hypothetical protein